MNFRSVADLAQLIRTKAYLIPDDIDLIVGIPRSGLLAANLIALALNLRVTDMIGLANDTPLSSGSTRFVRYPNIVRPNGAGHILVVDDSISSGGSIADAKQAIARLNLAQKVTYCAIYAAPNSCNLVDIYLEVLPTPRAFEWNLMHRSEVNSYCIDIDGVLCADPSDKENDDGINYRHFLKSARPLALPTYPVGCLVSSRLEKYRQDVEEWLRRHKVRYRELYLLDLPNANSRRKLAIHASFKAEVYRANYDSDLFIESERQQALDIANGAGKQSLCFATQELFDPAISYALLEYKALRASTRVKRAVQRITHKLLNG